MDAALMVDDIFALSHRMTEERDAHSRPRPSRARVRPRFETLDDDDSG